MTFIFPTWSAPSHIRAYTTTRIIPGLSTGSFAQFNVGNNTEEPFHLIQHNRDTLAEYHHTPRSIHWLHQVHGKQVHHIQSSVLPQQPVVADASITQLPNEVLAIITADCIPVLIYSPHSDEIAAIHAGWKGLAEDVIPETVSRLSGNMDQAIAWIAPHISQAHYEVDDLVRDAFIQKNPAYSKAFQASGKPSHFLFSLYDIARHQLQSHGISSIFHEPFCTFQQSDLFYSYRRDGQHTGRMATLIWKCS